MVHRLIDIAIADKAIGFAALLCLDLAARFPRQEFYAYAVPLAVRIPVLVADRRRGQQRQPRLSGRRPRFITPAARVQLVATGRRRLAGAGAARQ